MSEQQTVEVRFPGEKLATYTDESGSYTLYRTSEGLFRIHLDEGEGGLAWLESGRNGTGLTEAQVRTLFAEYQADTTRLGRGSPQGLCFPMSGDAGA